jgi:hypothetical protein
VGRGVRPAAPRARELGGERESVTALATFLSPDGQQPRLVAGSVMGELRVYDPEAGSTLHRLDGHTGEIYNLACIASSSAAPHHPRLVSGSDDGTARVWDGETGVMLADLGDQGGEVRSVAVWKEHTGGHDRIATASYDGHVRVWDGEALTLLHDVDCHSLGRLLPFASAEGPTRLLVAQIYARGLQVYDPEEGRRLQDEINRGCPFQDLDLFVSAEGRHLLAVVGSGYCHARHPDGTFRAFLDVWDLGETPARAQPLRPAHHLG